MAEHGTTFNLFRAALNPDPIRDFAEAGFFRLAFSATVVPVPTVDPELTAFEAITMNQVIDPLVTDLHRRVHTAHEAGNLFRAPVLLQSLSHPVCQPHAGPISAIVVSGSVVGTSSLLHFGR